MREDLYRCSCGRGFKTAQGMAGHRRFCTKASDEARTGTGDEELQQRLSALEGRLGTLLTEHYTLTDAVNELEQSIETLASYVCPVGKNLIGVNSSRIIKMVSDIAKAEEEMRRSQQDFERNIKGYVNAVLPPR